MRKHQISKTRSTLPTRIHRLAENNRFVFSLSVVSLFLLVFFAFLNPSFGTVTDVVIMLISSGTFSGEPSEFLLFSHFLIGAVLKVLYQLNRDIGWYPFFLIVVQVISMAVLLYALINRHFSLTRVCFFLVYMTLVLVYFLNELSFTESAFVAGQAGIFIILSTFRESFRSSWPQVSLGVALLTVSLMIRLDGFHLAVLLGLPMSLVIFWSDGNFKQKAILYKTVSVSFCLGLIYVSSGYIQTAYYNKDDSWAYAQRINPALAPILNYHRNASEDEIERAAEKVGWSVNDYQMMTSWFLADTTVFEHSQIQTVKEELDKTKREKVFSTDSITKIWRRFESLLSAAMPFLSAGILFLFFVQRKTVAAMVLTASIIVTIAVFCYMVLLLKSPTRVVFPLIYFASAVALFLVDKDFDLPSIKSWSRIRLFGVLAVFAVLVVFSGYSVARSLNKSKTGALESKSLQTSIDQLRLQEDELFVIWGSSFPFEKIRPFDDLRILKGMNIIFVSAFDNTSLFDNARKRFGIKNLYIDLYEKDKVYLVADPVKDRYDPDIYRQFCFEHYGAQVEFVVRYQDDNLTVLKPVEKIVSEEPRLVD